MRVLITGRGSIAQRHAQHLRLALPEAQLGVLTAASDLAALQPCERLTCLEDAWRWQPDALIVASASVRHADELMAGLARGLPCLVEKPLVTSAAQLLALRRAAAEAGRPQAVLVGCNLRYLASLQQMSQLLHAGALGRVLRAQLEAGQNLANWRPGRDLAASYSAQAAQGGGVLFDLVHEIDMARLLLGPLSVVGSVSAQLSSLPIDSDDVHVALLRTRSGAPVTVSLDYVCQQAIRRYTVVCENGTLCWDWVARRAWVEDAAGTRLLTETASDFDVAATYRAEMLDWLQAIREPGHRVLSPLDEALETAALMLAMKEGGS